MLDKIKAKFKQFIEFVKGLNLFLKYLVVIFIVFGIGTALGSPAQVGYLLTAMIIGAIGHYLYLLFKSSKKEEDAG